MQLMGNKRLGHEECPALGSAGFCVWVQKRIDDTAAVNKLFQDFINAAPAQHPKVGLIAGQAAQCYLIGVGV
jgi:hypothetical protein